MAMNEQSELFRRNRRFVDKKYRIEKAKLKMMPRQFSTVMVVEGKAWEQHKKDTQNSNRPPF
jgi:hypothetical protein